MLLNALFQHLTSNFHFILPCANLCHPYVVLFRWNILDYLEGEGDADEGAMELGEQTVVVPFPASQSVTPKREGHAWDDGEVDGIESSEKRTFRFLYSKRSTLHEGTLTIIDVKRQVLSLYGWQQHPFPCCMKRADEVVGADLIGQRMVEKNGAAILFLLNAFKQ